MAVTAVILPRQVKQGENYNFTVRITGLTSAQRPQGLANNSIKYPNGTMGNLNCSNVNNQQLGDGDYEMFFPAWHFTQKYGGLGNYSGVVTFQIRGTSSPLGTLAVNFDCVTELTPETGYLITNSDIEYFNSNNVAMSVNGSPIVLNTEINSGDAITVTPKSGYKITSASISETNLTINSDGSLASGNFPNTVTPVFNFKTKLLPKVVFTLANSSIDGTIEVYKNSILANAQTEFYDKDVLSFKLTDERKTVVRAYLTNSISGDLEITHTDFAGSVTLPYIHNRFNQLVITTKTTIAPYALESKDLTVINNAKTNMFVNTVKAIEGSVLKGGDSLSLVANANVLITSAYLTYGNPRQTVRFPIPYPSINKTDVVLPADFTGVWDVLFTVSSVDGTPPPDPEPEPGETVTINNVYKVNKSIMDAVSKQRFDMLVGEGDYSYIDYGSNILSLINLPFAISDDLIGDNARIMLGSKELTQSAPLIKTELLKVDLGKIKIENTFNDSRDYVGVVALLHLPRISPINIGLEYLIGKEITIEYLIDVYTGNATVNIKSLEFNEVIITKQVDLGFNIPIINLDSRTAENSNIELGGDNGVVKPFIEIVKTELILPDGFYTIPVVDEDKLINHKGYIEVDQINLDSSANYRERSLLINALKDGVIIK